MNCCDCCTRARGKRWIGNLFILYLAHAYNNFNKLPLGNSLPPVRAPVSRARTRSPPPIQCPCEPGARGAAIVGESGAFGVWHF